MPDDDLEALLADLHDHLAATEELPIDPRMNHWLGEAQAVAGDLVGADVTDETLARRVEHVSELLDHVEETGNDEADEHVAAARELAVEIPNRARE